MAELCTLCHGNGSLFTVQNGSREWWTCPACGGAGVRVLHGPAHIRIHEPKNRRPAQKKETKSASA